MNPETVNSEMNPETVNSENTTPADMPEVVEVKDGETKVLTPKKSSTEAFKAQWRHYGEQVSAFLSDLPNYVSNFFNENKGPLLTVALIIGGIVTFKLLLALLDAINDIPLVAPTFEVIGLVYTGWFVYRYLLRASSRKELSEEVKIAKEQVLGSQK